MASVFRKILLIAMFSLASLRVSAHPHSWIDIESYIDGSAQQIQGIRMLWKFDPMSSTLLLEGEALEDNKRQATLNRIALELIKNITEAGYFTEVYWNQQRVELAGASLGKLNIDGLNVSFSFYLSFKKPLALQQGSLTIQVFDPSYYVDMAWRSQDKLELASVLQTTCHAQLIEPNPTPEQLSYALALPIDAKPDEALGKLFAQQALITCN